MGILAILAIVAAFVGVPLGLVWWANRAQPGATNMVLIGTAAGEGEMETWVGALRHAGITSRVHNVGGSTWYPTGPYAYEVWVRAKDERRARAALGF